MGESKIASMKISKLVLKLVHDKRMNPAAPPSPVSDDRTPEPRPVQS